MDIYGTNRNDILTGTTLSEDIHGRNGNDLLRGAAGKDETAGAAMPPWREAPERMFSCSTLAMT